MGCRRRAPGRGQASDEAMVETRMIAFLET